MYLTISVEGEVSDVDIKKSLERAIFYNMFESIWPYDKGISTIDALKDCVESWFKENYDCYGSHYVIYKIKGKQCEKLYDYEVISELNWMKLFKWFLKAENE